MDINEETALADETPIAETNDVPTAREAIEKAFNTIDETDDETVDESTEVEAETTEGPTRGPDGKFVSKQPAEAKEVETPAEVTADAATPDAAPVAPEPVSHSAPARFSADARAEWAKAPVSVQAEINRAVTEMENGIAQKDQMLEPLKPYIKMAQDSGTTAHAAMAQYVGMEQLLAKDFRSGIERIANNLGKTLDEAVAELTGKQAQANPADRRMLEMSQAQNQINGRIDQMQQHYENQMLSQTEAQIEQFAQGNPRFEELSGEIAKLLQTGYAADLQSAYDMADKLSPLPVTPPPAVTSAPAQTRQPKSVTGSPSAGSIPANAQPSGTRNEALRRAFERVGL